MDKIADRSVSTSIDFDLAVQKRQWEEVRLLNEQLVASNSDMKQQVEILVQDKEELFGYFQRQHDEQQERISELEYVIEEQKTTRCKLEDQVKELELLAEDRDRFIKRLMSDVERIEKYKEMACMRTEDLENQFLRQNCQNKIELDHTIEKLCFRNRKYHRIDIVVPNVSKESKNDPIQLLAENVSLKAEITYQSLEIEKLLLCIRNFEMKSQEWKKQIRVLELNEVEISRQLFFSQKMVAHLHEKAAFTQAHPISPIDQTQRNSNVLTVIDHKESQSQLKEVETALIALKDEREYWLAQKNEIVMFLNQSIEEMASRRALDKDGDTSSISHPIGAIEVWADEAMDAMQALLEKLRHDRLKVGRRPELCNSIERIENRRLLERQLGMRLPALPLSSPSKPGHPSSPQSRKSVDFRCTNSHSSACGFKAGARTCSNTTRGAIWSRKDGDVKVGGMGR